MATLQLLQLASGEIIGRCDARCYDATDDRCSCICGGRNHGVGLRAAAHLTIAQADAFTHHLTIAGDPNRLVWTKNPILHTFRHPTLFDVLDQEPQP